MLSRTNTYTTLRKVAELFLFTFDLRLLFLNSILLALLPSIILSIQIYHYLIWRLITCNSEDFLLLWLQFMLSKVDCCLLGLFSIITSGRFMDFHFLVNLALLAINHVLEKQQTQNERDEDSSETLSVEICLNPPPSVLAARSKIFSFRGDALLINLCWWAILLSTRISTLWNSFLERFDTNIVQTLVWAVVHSFKFKLL